MKVFVTAGPNAGRVLDMSTLQARAAIARGWATSDLPKVAEPAAPPEPKHHDVEGDKAPARPGRARS